MRTIRIELPDSVAQLQWGSDDAFAADPGMAAAIQ